MAKWGEGDSRWKVEDLGESGRNVNAWHWEETNALPWAKDRLKELLGHKTLTEKDGTVIKTTDAITLTGDCVINQRKGKIIPAYELNLTLKWKGTDENGNKGTGEVKVPYISEENHDEDPEVVITASSSEAWAEKMRILIVNNGRQLVYKAIAEFVKELQSGGPIKGGGGGMKGGVVANGGGGAHGESQPPSTAPPSTSTVEGTNQPAQQQTNKSTSNNNNKSSTSSKSGRSIEITETFFASQQDVYECFTNPMKMRAYTGSPAEIDAREGGKFSMFGGSIEGTFRRLKPHEYIEMDWRFSSWPDGETSIVAITLEEKQKGEVALSLKQTEIPEVDRFGNHDVVAMTQSGWRQQVLLRIRQVFGFGA